MELPLKYRIVGVDAVSGTAREIEVEADSQKDALLWAREIGILTTRIETHALQRAPASSNNPHQNASTTLVANEASPPAIAPEQKAAVGGMVVLGGLSLVILLVCSGVFSGLANTSPPSPSYVPTSPNQSFSSDKERLEWRSKNHVPMNDEDLKYEQQKVLDELQKFKDSQSPVGR